MHKQTHQINQEMNDINKEIHEIDLEINEIHRGINEMKKKMKGNLIRSCTRCTNASKNNHIAYATYYLERFS